MPAAVTRGLNLNRIEAFSHSPGSHLRLQRIVTTPTENLGTTGLTRCDTERTVAPMDASVDMSRKLTPGVPTFMPTTGALEKFGEVCPRNICKSNQWYKRHP